MNSSKRTIITTALIFTVGVGGLIFAYPWNSRQPNVATAPPSQAVAETSLPGTPLSTQPATPIPTASLAPASTPVVTPPVAVPTPTPTARPQETVDARPSQLGNRGEAPSRSAGQDLNAWVLDALDGYAGGSYPYLLNTDYSNYNGVTANISYKNSLIAKANPNGNRASHCTGITFEVFYKAMQARNRELGISINDFNGMTASDLRNFMQMWYVAGSKSSNNVAAAVEQYGLGRRISNLADAKPGDFVDFSRTNGTGHTVVLINWIWQDGEIVGLKYWSSQASTDGISYNTEYFSPKGKISRSPVYIARVGAVNEYR